MIVEIRINLNNMRREWDAITPQQEEFASWELAVNYAKKIAYEYSAEIRLNHLGSFQGHYFRA